MDAAAKAVKGNPTYAERVALTAEGVSNAEQYVRIHKAMEAGDFSKAMDVYHNYRARNRKLFEKGHADRYTLIYMQRFLGNQLRFAAATAPPNKILVELPDNWRFRRDMDKVGLSRGYQKPEFDDSDWEVTHTYSESMTSRVRPKSEGGSRGATLWLRNSFELPAKHGKVVLAIKEVPSTTTVYLNGRELNNPADGPKPGHRNRTVILDVTDAVRDGKNVIAMGMLFKWGKLTTAPVTLADKAK